MAGRSSNKVRIDLHTHSTASDGLLAPAALVAEAKRQGVDVLALTDHDTMAGVDEAAAAAAEAGIDFIPGVELNTDAPKGELHILGYCIAADKSSFQALLQRRQDGRRQRAHKMVQRLRHIGCNITMDDVERIAEGGVVARPHVARALVEGGYADDVAAAFDRFVGKGQPGYVPREGFTAYDAVQAILAAGGVPVLAHPGRMATEKYIEPLIDAGLQGIECFYPEHTAEQTARYVQIARRYDLVVTGGSDFHGVSLRSEGRLGSVATPEDAAIRLLERQRRLARTAR